MARVAEIFLIFLRLGLTSFGGPIAHLGYFRTEFVERRRWMDDGSYADVVALCQFLPGPASSQVGMAIGLTRAGLPGALAAWLGFTLPSAILMVLFAYGVGANAGFADAGWLHGLKVAAVAVVALAVLGMARSLAPDRERATLAVITACLALAMPNAMGQLAAIGLGALIGAWRFRTVEAEPSTAFPGSFSRKGGIIALVLFAVLLIGLPLLALATTNHAIDLFDAFYRSGALVFGGGHVVLPLLQAETVPPGWISDPAFLAGYGAAQAVPGPLFTFAAYLGAAMTPSPNGWIGAALCLVAIFLPSALLVAGAMPFWNQLRALPLARAMLRGVNAAVVGLLLAAFYDPVWTAGITSAADFGLASAAFLLLMLWRTPPWLVVILCAIGGALLGMV